MELHRSDKIIMWDETTRSGVTLIPSYRVQVQGKDADAHYIASQAQEVLNDLQSHVSDVVHDLSHDDEPVKITIEGGGFSPVVFTIQRWYMTRQELRKLPPFKARGGAASDTPDNG